MSSYPYKDKDIRMYIDEIRSIAGIIACALVSCEGQIMGEQHLPGDNLLSSLFATMSATVLAAAETVCSSVCVQQPLMISIGAEDATVLIASAGGVVLITAVIDKSADLPIVKEQISDIAARIGEVV